MSAFANLQDELSIQGIDMHPSELHGQLVGYLCAVKEGSGAPGRAALYQDWLGGGASTELTRLLEQLAAETQESLGDYSDFEFRLMRPEDAAPLTEQATAIAGWCGGFISGFGEAGRHDLDDDGMKNVREALNDLSKIAAMPLDIPEGSDNEADLIEIEEFVRVSALLIYSEINAAKAH